MQWLKGLLVKEQMLKIYLLHEDERSEIVKDMLDSKAVAFGIPTIYDKPFPSVGILSVPPRI